MGVKGFWSRVSDHGSYGDNHSFIWGVKPSYVRGPDECDCALRGKEQGKCWGEVRPYDILEEGGDMVYVCRGHDETFDQCRNPEARNYIEEPNV